MRSELVYRQAWDHVNKFGRTTNADSGTATDIWDGANPTDNQPIWLAPTQARIHDIVSTDVNDDGSPAGTGARTVRIYGLTDWASLEVSEDVTLNGTSSVATANSYVIIHRMEAIPPFGASGPNVGDIKATAQTDNTLSAQINAGNGQTGMAIFGIPSGVTMAVERYYASVQRNANTSVDIALLFAPDPENTPTVFLVKETVGLATSGNSFVERQPMPRKEFDGPGILKMQATASGNNADVSAGFDAPLIRT